MPENTVQFLPFSAINEFMRADFRLTVIKNTLTNLRELPDNKQDQLNRLIKQTVKIPGFRNSDKAPSAVKVLPTIKSFESNPKLTAAILSAWSELNSELRQQVNQVLKDRGWYFFPDENMSPTNLPELKTEKDWGILPIDADRTLLPGFLIFWPKNQDFEEIYESYNQKYPEGAFSIDEVSLMAVWLANRLPYQIVEDDTTNPSDQDNE